ncbi:MAG: putative Oxidoreductase, 2OG-Fe(II) oxygenase family [Acidimicrobiales bacterium]|nr:putative Oxidoreductase, 2OG-Fe(II) oxygenase family [Acidimicrobiales bacterium]
MASLDVPVIDLEPWRTGSVDARAAVAAAVDHACRTSGFFQVVGHGVPPELIDHALDEIDRFFHLPLAEKMAIRPASDAINRGFLPLGSEALSYTVGVDAPADLREVFVIGPDALPEDPRHHADAFNVFTPNLWPAKPDGLKPAMLAYFDAIVALAKTMVDIYAVALQLEPAFFRGHVDHSTETLRVNYYERLAPGEPIADGQQRLGAHTDYGITTVLYADRVPGLQLLDLDGDWHDVLAEPGAFIVNLGDLLAQWTNDRWRSTVHRVVATGGQGTRRRSIAFFLDGNYDSVIECLRTCCDEDHPARYAPTTAGAHLVEKLRGARTLTKVETLDTVGDRIDALRRS